MLLLSNLGSLCLDPGPEAVFLFRRSFTLSIQVRDPFVVNFCVRCKHRLRFMSLFSLLFFVFLFEVHLCLWMSHCSSLVCWKNCLSSVVSLCTFLVTGGSCLCRCTGGFRILSNIDLLADCRLSFCQYHMALTTVAIE